MEQGTGELDALIHYISQRMPQQKPVKPIKPAIVAKVKQIRSILPPERKRLIVAVYFGSTTDFAKPAFTLV